MAGYNSCTFIGNLGADPEVKDLPSGKKVANLRLAVGRKFTKDGQLQEETEWVSVVCFDKLAETVAQYLVKGRQIMVEGRMQTRSWEAENGEKKYRTEIVARVVQFLGTKGDMPEPVAAGVSGGFDVSDMPF